MPHIKSGLPNFIIQLAHFSSTAIGFRITRIKNDPARTLLGLGTKPIRTIIDCGANSGQFARTVLSFFPQAKLFCIEPLEEPYAELTRWAMTRGHQVRCFNVALGQEEGERTMHYHVHHNTSSSFLMTTAHKISVFPDVAQQTDRPVKMTTLDRLLEAYHHEIRGDILLKLDVQGYELHVLNGAMTLLPKVDACIIEINIDHFYEGQPSFSELVGLLNAYGLEYAGNLQQHYADDGRVMWIDAVFARKRR